MPVTHTFILGAGIVTLAAVFGSFFNVLVCRLPLIRAGAEEHGKPVSLSHPASRCPNCQSRVPWYCNVPVLGWIILLGRCKQCRKHISASYPAVELGAAFLAAIPLAYLGAGAEAYILTAFLLSQFALALCLKQRPLRSSKTWTILLTMVSLPALIAALPSLMTWITDSNQQLAALTTISSLTNLTAILVFILLESLLLYKGRGFNRYDIVSLAALALVFVPTAAVAIWMIARISMSDRKDLPVTSVVAPRLALITLPALILSIGFEPIAQAVMTPAWFELISTNH